MLNEDAPLEVTSTWSVFRTMIYRLYRDTPTLHSLGLTFRTGWIGRTKTVGWRVTFYPVSDGLCKIILVTNVTLNTIEKYALDHITDPLVGVLSAFMSAPSFKSSMYIHTAREKPWGVVFEDILAHCYISSDGQLSMHVTEDEPDSGLPSLAEYQVDLPLLGVAPSVEPVTHDGIEE